MKQESLLFETCGAFRAWLQEHCLQEEGVWLIFGKKGGLKTLSAGEALEEALCFGWIDGQMRSIDETCYIKYFKQRNKKSCWSQKNRKLVEMLEDAGRMTGHGRVKIEEARRNGTWDPPKQEPVTKEQIQSFIKVLEPHRKAHENYTNMTPSVQKTYASAYVFGAKTDAGKEKNLHRIVQRLTLNLNPMESLQKALDQLERQKEQQDKGT